MERSGMERHSSGSDCSDSEDSSLSDSEVSPSLHPLQEAFAKGELKPGLNVVLEGQPKKHNDVVRGGRRDGTGGSGDGAALRPERDGLKQCLSDFKQQLAWVERLDVTLDPIADAVESVSQSDANKDAVDPENDFQREMSFYRQAQAAVLEALPRLRKLHVPTRRPDDYFAEMAKSDQQMQKIRQKLKSKQEAMEKSEKAKQLRAMRKYGKKVQIEILQRRQKEKKNMLNAVKKYQKGLTDKLDFLDEEQTSSQGNKKGGANRRVKKGPNAKRRYKDQKFGFGGKKKGSKWNTKDSFNDVSSFKSKVAHNKGPRKGGKKAANKRPGKRARQKMKSRAG
ncbi:probable rRNA-processing protein EBP2 [Coturnix japonica]|uniref:probable rRNA-processing protein EBP2 n=1 Tax=Coturnix japonica TaxID=93934 RepID=UPI000777B3A2|nr:probable rRNA-processing protein EBP2 [Coturnix japonica]